MIRAHFHLLDWLPLLLYMALLMLVGFKRRRTDTESYLIADRNLSLPLFVATLVATWYGGILGAGQFYYTDGLSAWFANGIPYYLFAIGFALFLARKVRLGSVNLYTIPDKLESEYGRSAALLGAVLAFLYATPSQYVLMIGVLLKLLFGWSLLLSMSVGMLFSVAYVFQSGFLADVRVNMVQFILMFAGFAALVWICLTHYGGLSAITAPGNLPASYLHPLGSHGLLWMGAWFAIALQTFTDPGFHQRCYAARTPRTAAVGILIAVLCWFLFDMLTLISGLFARHYLPDLSNPTFAFPSLADKIMPTGWKGFFYVGMLAPIMASAVSYTFIAAITIGRDFIWRLRNETHSQNVPAYTRLGLLLVCPVSVGIAALIPSVVLQWYLFGNLMVSGLLIPLAAAYLPTSRWKATPRFAFLSMLAGSAAALISIAHGWNGGSYTDSKALFGLPPLIPGGLLCAALYAIGIFQRRKQDVAQI